MGSCVASAVIYRRAGSGASNLARGRPLSPARAIVYSARYFPASAGARENVPRANKPVYPARVLLVASSVYFVKLNRHFTYILMVEKQLKENGRCL